MIRVMNSDGLTLRQKTLDDVPYYAGGRAWPAPGIDGKLIFVTSEAWAGRELK